MIQHYVMIRGDTKLIDVTLYEDEIPMTLTTAAITFTVDGLFSKTLNNGIELVPPDSGSEPGAIEITIDPEDTEDAPNARLSYSYDIQVTDSGVVSTPLRGTLTILPDVTE